MTTSKTGRKDAFSLPAQSVMAKEPPPNRGRWTPSPRSRIRLSKQEGRPMTTQAVLQGEVVRRG